MPIRNTHRVGDWLMVDEESGHTVYRSQCRKIWDGTFRRTSQFESRQPQELVKARSDPKALTDIRVEDTFAVPCNVQPTFVGNTNIRTKDSAGSHLFGNPGIGDAEIGCSFVVE